MGLYNANAAGSGNCPAQNPANEECPCENTGASGSSSQENVSQLLVFIALVILLVVLLKN